MALYAFDGTSNTWHTKTSDLKKNTNVVRFYQAYDKNCPPTIANKYVPGVGTRFGLLGKVIGGAFGVGELRRVHEAYDHVCERWQHGDRDIDIIGFSRGAATALDFCNLIKGRGIRAPDSETIVEPKPVIRFVGLWDVVAAFGLANLGLTDFNFGHHLSIPEGQVKYAFHALALDERRPSFLVTRLNGAYEVWFRGVHSDVGGGNRQIPRNNISLKWMLSKAKAAELPISDGDLAALAEDAPKPPVFDLLHRMAPIDVRTVSDVDRKHYTVEPMSGCRDVPVSCLVESELDERIAVLASELSLLPSELENRVIILANVARAKIQSVGLPFAEETQEAILALIHHRIRLVDNDGRLPEAKDNLIALIDKTVHFTLKHQFRIANEFFLTEALQALWPIYPFSGEDE